MDKEVHNRKSVRLKEYDYAQSGLYFVTVCTFNKECLFGKIKNGAMVINNYGEIVRDEWVETKNIRDDIKLHQFVIMPNHIHGIIEITQHTITPQICRGVSHTPVMEHVPNESNGAHSNTPLRSPSRTVGAIIRGVKSAATKRINKIRQTPGAKLWQRNYYDHIIRNEKSYLEISEYIINNPLRWHEDKFYNP